MRVSQLTTPLNVAIGASTATAGALTCTALFAVISTAPEAVSLMLDPLEWVIVTSDVPASSTTWCPEWVVMLIFGPAGASSNSSLLSLRVRSRRMSLVPSGACGSGSRPLLRSQRPLRCEEKDAEMWDKSTIYGEFFVFIGARGKW